MDHFVQVKHYEITTSMDPNKLNVNIPQFLSYITEPVQIYGSHCYRPESACTAGVKGGPRQGSQYSDSLRAVRPGDRIPVQARFPAHVQTGPGARPAL